MVTQAQIARKLGVPRQLVTFALSGYPQISENSRERILSAAREMGYSHNPYARALRKGRSGIIGLWIPDQISTLYKHVARKLNRLVKAAQRGLIVSEVSIAEEQQMLSHVPMDGIFVVDENDLQSLLGAVEQALDAGERRKHGNAALEFARNHFNLSATCAGIVQLLEGSVVIPQPFPLAGKETFTAQVKSQP
jgi:hypothetical protein